MDGLDALDSSRRTGRKRKAESQENQRLSKRMGLLNIEKSGGPKLLYVPVENPAVNTEQHQQQHQHQHEHQHQHQHQAQGMILHGAAAASSSAPRSAPVGHPNHPHQSAAVATAADDTMHLDDTRHRVYIYNLDDELSSSDSEPDDGRLVFLTDLDRHLRTTRIPPRVLPNDDGELAGVDMQLVLYREPVSLTVSGEQDGVRRVVAEARERIRERQRAEREASSGQGQDHHPLDAVWSGTPGGQKLAPGMQDVQDQVAQDDFDAMDMS